MTRATKSTAYDVEFDCVCACMTQSRKSQLDFVLAQLLMLHDWAAVMPCCGRFGNTMTHHAPENAGSHVSLTTTIHPQMLRLDELAIGGQQQSAEAPGPVAAADHAKADTPTRKAKLAPFNPHLKADAWLLQMDLKGVEGGPPMQPPPALLLDLNDANMTFEVLRGTEVEEFASAAATMLPAMPKVLSLLSQKPSVALL